MPPSAASSRVAAPRQAARKIGSNHAPFDAGRALIDTGADRGVSDIVSAKRKRAGATRPRPGRSRFPLGLLGNVDRLAVRALRPGPPSCLRIMVFTATGMRHVVQVAGRGVAVLVGPVEELQDRLALGGVGLLLVTRMKVAPVIGHELGARLVEQQQVVARSLGPVGVAGGGGEVSAATGPRYWPALFCTLDVGWPCSAWRRRIRRSRSSRSSASRRPRRRRCPCRPGRSATSRRRWRRP